MTGQAEGDGEAVSDAMDKLAEWMGASSGEELRVLHDNLKLYESLLSTALEAIDKSLDTEEWMVTAESGRFFDDQARHDFLAETASRLRSQLESPT